MATHDLAMHLPTSITGFSVIMTRFADDTQIGVTGPRARLGELQAALGQLLEIMGTWFAQNGMRVNAAKTELILIGERRQLQYVGEGRVNVQFLGETLQPAQCVRNLGVKMGCNLSWEPHIAHVVSKCTGILIGLASARHLLPRHLLPQIVDALVLSHVRYCIQVYGSANAGQIAKLQKVINFAARVVSGRRKYDHISDCTASLGWLPAQKLVTYSDLCLLHEIDMTGQPSSLSQYLQVNRDRTARDTRTANHLSLPRVRNNHGKRAFIYRSVTMYNKHVIAKGADGLSLRKFKKTLETH